MAQKRGDRYEQHIDYQHACCAHNATSRGWQAPYQQHWPQSPVSYQSEQLDRIIPYHQRQRGVINEKSLASEVSNLLKAIQCQAQLVDEELVSLR